MDKNAMWKWLILIGLTCWSVVLVTPVREKVKLGLDLRGGTSYLLEIDDSALDDNARKDAQPRALEIIRNRVDALGVAEPIIYPQPDGKRIVVQIPGLRAEDRARAMDLIQSAAYLEFRLVHPKNDELVTKLFEDDLAPEGFKIVNVAGETRHGGRYYRRDKTADAGRTEQQIRDAAASFRAPPGHVLMLMREMVNNQEYFYPYYVNRRADLSGENLVNAGVEYSNLQVPYVTLKFDAIGARKFARLTADNAPGGDRNRGEERRYLAIVLDGMLYSAPWIKTAIYGGNAIIEGEFSLRDAQNLAIALRAGSLPAPVKIVEERTVDPTLGRDSVSSGTRAALFGGIAVAVFMAAYYLIPGLIANVALLLDLLLLPFGMMLVGGIFSMFDGGIGLGAGRIGLPTLTLPGIAGIALTLGMAVDANVLIFERMREEQRAGKSLAAAVPAGYDKAFTTIFDSNITTLLAAVIMFWQGAGPVRGYAVTLSAGILVSMFTAIVVTRLLFNLILRHTQIKQLRMMQWIRDTKIDFLGARRVCLTASLALLAVCAIFFMKRGQGNYGIDFTGGTSVVFNYDQTHEAPVDLLRKALSDAGVKDAVPSYQQKKGDVGDAPVKLLEVKAAFGTGPAISKTVAEKFPQGAYVVLSEDSVGRHNVGMTALLNPLLYLHRSEPARPTERK